MYSSDDDPRRFLANATKVANTILAGGAAISLVALIYNLYLYGWTGQRQFATFMGGAWYYALPALLVALLIASLRLKPAYKIAVAVLSFVLTTSAYGVEVYLNVLEHARFRPDKPLLAIEGESKEVKQQAAKIAKQFGVDVDTRDRIQVIEEFANQGIEAVPQIILPIFDQQTGDGVKSAIRINGVEVMPLSGISDKMTVVCNQNGDYLTYRSDEHGFHNPKGNWGSRNLEIAAVGNSFTMGYCVPSEKNFVALMRERYPAILNLGMAGEGPLQILATLKEYLEPLRPKRVLWFYYEGNNLAELRHEKRSPLLMRYMQDGFLQGLAGRQSAIDHALMAYVKTQQAKEVSTPRKKSNDALARMPDIFKLTGLRKQLGLVYGRNMEEIETASEANLNLFREILVRAKQRVGAWGGEIYFIYLPNGEQFAQTDSGIGGQRRAQILSYVDSLDLSLIDVLPAFAAQADPLSLFPFKRLGHYNEKGHRLVADEVLKSISSGRYNKMSGIRR
jgi:hypothetical protein